MSAPRVWKQIGEFIWACDTPDGQRRVYGEFPGGSAEAEEFYQQSERDAAAHAAALAAGCED